MKLPNGLLTLFYMTNAPIANEEVGHSKKLKYMYRHFLRMLLLIIVFLYSANNVVVAQGSGNDFEPAAYVQMQNLLKAMTLDEKIDFLLKYEVPRLNIKDPGNAEGIHQAVLVPKRTTGTSIPATSFSQVYGMGETWNPDLIKMAGSVMAYEARYVSQNEKYNRPSLVLWGPTSDLARDPRWGRTDESYGEDAFLTGQMATAYAKGIQGEHPKYWMAGALLKHFFANSNETTRTRSSSDFDERLMREYYAKPFEMVFTKAGTKAYMASYNMWNGMPLTLHPMLRDVVAKEWGADWIVSSDFLALTNVINHQKYLKTPEEVIAAAIKVGMNQYLDFRMPDIKAAVDKNLLSEQEIDKVVLNKLKMTFKLGLMDDSENNPYAKIGRNGETEPWLSEKHKSVALKVAQESVVLLKNERVLPLDKSKIHKVVVVGPYADSVLHDFYSGPTPYSISILQGLKEKLGPGVEVRFFKDNDYNVATNAAKDADFVFVVVGNDPMCGTVNLGEAFNTDGSTKECKECGEGREGRDRQSLDLPREELAKELYAVNKNTVLVLTSSFPYAIVWSQKNLPAILHTTHAAQEQGHAIADVIFGDYNPAGRLTQTWPTSLSQLPRMMEYNIRNGRTYMYSKEKPLYPFGYGLSYAKFEYAQPKLSKSTIRQDENLEINLAIKNNSPREGDEVVQLYLQFPDSKVSRPMKSLQGFKRIAIKAGETQTIQFKISPESLAYWNVETQKWEVEKGKVNVLLGSSSENILQKSVFTVN